MTLIVSGYSDNRKLFFAADSTISDGNRTLLSGFQKVYQVPVVVYEPYFIGDYFQRYLSFRTHTHCAIAFAGSTLTAQHVLNSITSCLGSLLFGQDESGTYAILRSDEYNELIKHKRAQAWAEDMFLPEDMKGLLTGEVIARAVEHAVQQAVESAWKYTIDDAGFKKLENQYAIGTYAPDSDTVDLFEIFVARASTPEGLAVPRVQSKRVAPDEVSVLGMGERFKHEAEVVFRSAQQSPGARASVMFKFLNKAIDTVWAEGSRAIDKPAYCYEFSATGLVLSSVSGPSRSAA